MISNYVPMSLNGNMSLPSEATVPTATSVPEAALCASLLARMVADYLTYAVGGDISTESRINGIHARMWLNSERQYAENEFGLDWVCEVLGADPDWVRRKVKEMAEGRRNVDMNVFGRVCSLVLSGDAE